MRSVLARILISGFQLAREVVRAIASRKRHLGTNLDLKNRTRKGAGHRPDADSMVMQVYVCYITNSSASKATRGCVMSTDVCLRRRTTSHTKQEIRVLVEQRQIGRFCDFTSELGGVPSKPFKNVIHHCTLSYLLCTSCPCSHCQVDRRTPRAGKHKLSYEWSNRQDHHIK